MSKHQTIVPVIAACLMAFAMSVRAEPAAAGPVDEIAGITRKVYPSVVRVEAKNGMRKVATGVVIDNDGYIVTTALISPRDEKITVSTGDGKESEAEFLGFDPETHLALIRAKDKKFTPLTLGRSVDLAPGSWICVVGISPEETPAVTQGIVSSVSAERLRLNIWVTPGSSGGPVVNEKGEMVGLLRGIYTEDRPVLFEFRDREQVGSGYVLGQAETAPSSGMSLAVPVDIVKKVTVEIKEKGKVERGWLGISIVRNERGMVEIASVDPESPAEAAGLREGDIILKVEGKALSNADVLSSEIRKRKPGQDVGLSIEREGQAMDIRAKLGEYSGAAAQRDLETKFPRLFPQSPALPKGRVESKGRPVWLNRRYIGVYLQELNTELSEFFGLKEGRGLLVTQISENGPAKKAGLKVGDVVTKIDGKKADDIGELSRYIQDKKKGDRIKVEILREKKPAILDIEVAEEERGSTFNLGAGGDEDLQAWMDYTNAFKRQLNKWEEQYGSELKAGMRKLNEEIARQSKESAQKLEKRINVVTKPRSLKI
ncbi:MAG TPA: PDZ domain-containing protein [Candidatus Aminicenantes bacterium]|nr:PDZ domain-containing protein [Candidatus Aminicenantes bacterium]